MALNLDSALGFHAQSLRTHSKRSQVIANNIANVDTPQYKARDIDFASVLQKADSKVSLKATCPGHFGAGRQLLPEVERPAFQRTENGNTVDVHIEKAEFARSTMLYSASLTFLSSRINGLPTAIRGRQLIMSIMKMFTTAASALDAQSVRLNLVASNLANAQTVSTLPRPLIAPSIRCSPRFSSRRTARWNRKGSASLLSSRARPSRSAASNQGTRSLMKRATSTAVMSMLSKRWQT